MARSYLAIFSPTNTRSLCNRSCIYASMIALSAGSSSSRLNSVVVDKYNRALTYGKAGRSHARTTGLTPVHRETLGPYLGPSRSRLSGKVFPSFFLRTTRTPNKAPVLGCLTFTYSQGVPSANLSVSLTYPSTRGAAASDAKYWSSPASANVATTVTAAMATLVRILFMTFPLERLPACEAAGFSAQRTDARSAENPCHWL